ncbi:MAG: transposase [Candidatus Acidiferrum sp.]
MKHRRHRLARPAYLGYGTYFLTICVLNRKPLFPQPSLVGVILSSMEKAFRNNNFLIEAYCFMPDHCHILAGALSENCDLARAVRAFKGVSTPCARELGIRNLWQPGYYDHILRADESVNSVAAYIFGNPVRAGLVDDPHDWPFSGSFHFEWRKVAVSEVGAGLPRGAAG